MSKTTLALALVAVGGVLFAGRVEAGAPTPSVAVGTPPAPDSEEAKEDLAVVLWEQRVRTAAQVLRAAAEVKLDFADFAEALGLAFDPSRYPLTQDLLKRVWKDSRPAVRDLQERFARPRPFIANPQVKPAVEADEGFSFPSGHATRGVLFAEILSLLAPERRSALFACGLRIGYGRVLVGMHYPSDVLAGQRLGGLLAEIWLGDPNNLSALENVRGREWPATPALPITSSAATPH